MQITNLHDLQHCVRYTITPWHNADKWWFDGMFIDHYVDERFPVTVAVFINSNHDTYFVNQLELSSATIMINIM